MEKLIITVAPTGKKGTKQHHPRLPMTPAEIAEEVYQAWQAGASIVHLHVRDSQGKDTHDLEIFKETIELIRQRCDIIIQISTSGTVEDSIEDRLAPIALRPEMATLIAGTVNFQDEVFYSPKPYMELAAKKMREYGVKPELDVMEVGAINNAQALVEQGLISPPLHFNLLFGLPGSIPGSLKNVLYMVDNLPAGSTWSLSAVGRWELPLTTMAILLGGHVRVGFEDNLYYSKGIKAESNAQLVERVVRIARELEREAASPAEARKILGIV
ncbi:MAG: 3-keto-5-aminohexanoate cleavage protein [Firmicutes bacterium]|nr:3-keto-5-aminohexanoate cleavage protein [Bacillota bacterium]